MHSTNYYYVPQHYLATATAHRGNTKCRYVYKDCQNARSYKRNGEMHTLCEFHRAKANTIQKLYARKKRHMHSALQAAGIAPPPPRAVSKSIDPIPYEASHASDCEGDDGAWLTDVDVAILRQLIC